MTSVSTWYCKYIILFKKRWESFVYLHLPGLYSSIKEKTTERTKRSQLYKDFLVSESRSQLYTSCVWIYLRIKRQNPTRFELKPPFF